MSNLILLLVLFSQVSLVTENYAQESFSELFTEEEYLVGPGDLLFVILKDISFSYITAINFDGNMPLMVPFFTKDSVVARPAQLKRVYNISLKEIKDSLKIWYRDILKVSEFDVTVTSPRVVNILVKGRTETNGPVSLKASLRLTNLLSIANYMCSYDADINKVLVETKKGETLFVDLESYFKTGSLVYNPILAKIKSVYVPQIKEGVVVFGAAKGYPVKRFMPQLVQALGGNFTVSFEANVIKIPCNDSIKVSDAIDKAGGVKSYAVLDELYSAKKGRVGLEDYIIKGDTLYIPPFTDKVFVAGEVKNPGFVPYLPGANLDTYLSYCGGYTSRAASHRLYVIRGKTKIRKSKIGSILPGDIIFVPEVRLKWFEDYLTIAQVLSSLVITWVTLSKI